MRKFISRYFPLIPAVVVIVMSVFSHSCANTTQAPKGGLKDTIPPVVVKVSPKPGSMKVPVHGAEIVFTFNEPFLYNGGNLAVEALVTEAGSYGSEKFYGIALTGASYGYYNDFGWENRVYDFLPKATFGYVKEETPEPEVMRGDVNKDKAVNIADVTALIDMLLGGAEMIPEADCNLDNAMNIADVTTLIDFLLNGTW